MKPLKELTFNSQNITATMTSRQFQVMLDVLTNLLFARPPKWVHASVVFLLSQIFFLFKNIDSFMKLYWAWLLVVRVSACSFMYWMHLLKNVKDYSTFFFFWNKKILRMDVIVVVFLSRQVLFFLLQNWGPLMIWHVRNTLDGFKS